MQPAHADYPYVSMWQTEDMLGTKIALLGILPMIGAIIFLKEPSNITTFEGEFGYFACEYSGIRALPSWRISNIVYGSTSLPLDYTYNGTGLIVSHITREMNGISISCFFPLSNEDIESTTGYIIVIVESQVESSSSQIPSHVFSATMASFGSATATKRKSTHHFTVLLTTLPSIASISTYTQGFDPVKESKQNKIDKQNKILIVSLSSGLLVLLSMNFILIFIYKGRRRLLKRQQSQGPLYDEVKIPQHNALKMTNNTAYTSPHETVQMQINESYASTRCVQEEQAPKAPDPTYEAVY